MSAYGTNSAACYHISAASRRIIPLFVVLFNFILIILAAVDIDSRRVFNLSRSQASASDLLCVISVLTVVVVSMISYLNYLDPSWMQFTLIFEYSWVGGVVLFQFITAIILTADSHDVCRESVKACGISHASLAFVWMSVILLFIHLMLLTYSTHQISSLTRISFAQVLRTPYEDLVHFTSNDHITRTASSEPFSRHGHGGGASEKSQLPQSAGLGLGGKRKAPPPSLKLSESNINTAISLPIYRTFASSNMAARKTPSSMNPTPENTIKLKPQPNRHQLMAFAQPQSQSQLYLQPPVSRVALEVARLGGTDRGSSNGAVAGHSPEIDPGADHDDKETQSSVYSFGRTIDNNGEDTLKANSKHPYTHRPNAAPFIDGATNWAAPKAWAAVAARPDDLAALGVPYGPADSMYSMVTTTSISELELSTRIPVRSRSLTHKTSGSSRHSKQLPAVPGLARSQSHAIRPPPQAAHAWHAAPTYHNGGTGIVDRPDPRDRRPPGIGEITEDGGFWVQKATRAMGEVDLEKAATGKGKTSGKGKMLGQTMNWI